MEFFLPISQNFMVLDMSSSIVSSIKDNLEFIGIGIFTCLRFIDS